MSLEELSERADRISGRGGTWNVVITRGERPRQRLNRFSPVPETILIRTIAARSRAMLRAGLNIYAIAPLKNTDSDFDELTSVSAGPGHGLQFMPKYRSTIGEGRGSLSAAALDPTACLYGGPMEFFIGSGIYAICSPGRSKIKRLGLIISLFGRCLWQLLIIEVEQCGNVTCWDPARDNYTYTCNLYTGIVETLFPFLFSSTRSVSSRELRAFFKKHFLRLWTTVSGGNDSQTGIIIVPERRNRKIIIWNCETSGIAQLGPYPATWPKWKKARPFSKFPGGKRFVGNFLVPGSRRSIPSFHNARSNVLPVSTDGLRKGAASH